MIADCPMQTSCALSPDDVVREVKHLPSAPKVLPRLKQLLGDGNSAMHDIVMLIRLDPGIAARVLQMANSAYFSKGTRCFTVDEAVHRVGYDQVYELVAYAVASQVLIRPLAVYGIDADELWKQSVACALAAETLAMRTGQDRNVAYTIGLLHSVGMVAIDEWALRHARTLTLASTGFQREATEAERAALGFTQAEAGAALLRHWDFPRSMSEPVRWQYAPRASAGHTQMASLLYAAKWLRTAVCTGTKARMPLPDAAPLQPLSLSPVLLQGMVFEIDLQLADISSLLDMENKKAGERDRHRFPTQG
jgi:HD-like signal output (HDOD) protein